mmetsp:Transcript_45111/g.128842  ORF Transcript_45111/g.128842 Transcript_45111/m.128842 type:complete len:365 (+) Transcript_45111:55-1149(+)
MVCVAAPYELWNEPWEAADCRIEASASCQQLSVIGLCQSLSVGLNALVEASGICTEKGIGNEPAVGVVHERLRLVHAQFSAVDDHEAASRRRADEAAEWLLSTGVPAKLVLCLGVLDFEAQMNAMRVFTEVLRRGACMGVEQAISDHICSHPQVLPALLDGCGRRDVFFPCAEMMRACTKCPELVAAFLDAGAAARLMALAQHSDFDISSEAFASLRKVLLSHPDITAEFLMAHFTSFFGLYHSLVLDTSYVTQRQAIRLLSEVLLSPKNGEAMLKYASSTQFLQIHMRLLKHSSCSIRLEAFHVFKVFVANPDQPHPVCATLRRNKDRLARLLATFGELGHEDTGFFDDLAAVLTLLRGLPPA